MTRTVTYNAQPAEVLAEMTGKRGRTLLTLRLADGREIKVDSRMVPPEVKFAPPCSAEEFFRPLKSSAQVVRDRINGRA